MDLLQSLEIYIPVEAEVKRIRLSSLPNSVLRRMGLPQADTEGSWKLTESPEGIWICPAVLRRKGQKLSSRASNGGRENMSSLIGRELRAAPGPFRMSFVSSNRSAYKVLKNTMPGEMVSAHTSHMPPLPPGSAQQAYQDAVVVYSGRIYLSIRKPNRGTIQRTAHEPQPASQSAIPSTSHVSSKHQKHQSPQASLERADKEIQRKRLRITLPQISAPKKPKTDSRSTTDLELLNEDTPKNYNACKVTQSENRKDAKHKGRNVSSSKAGGCVPQSTDSVHNKHFHKNARGEHAADKAAGLESAWCPLQREKEEVASIDGEIQGMGDEESESTNQNTDMNSNINIESGEADGVVGIVEQIGNRSWTRRESPSEAGAFAPRQQDFDFKELEQQEKIAQMQAKLRKSEAALNDLPSL